MWDLFFPFELIDIASYADGTVPSVYCGDIDLITEIPEVKKNKIHQWFNENLMKAKTDKFHLLVKNKRENIFLFEEKQYKVIKRKILLES